MGGGDDYELVLVVPEKNNQAFCRTTAEHLVAVTEVGVITGGDGVWLVDEQGATIRTEALGYKHAF
jgi:thiamine monophosphate kinase